MIRPALDTMELEMQARALRSAYMRDVATRLLARLRGLRKTDGVTA